MELLKKLVYNINIEHYMTALIGRGISAVC